MIVSGRLLKNLPESRKHFRKQLSKSHPLLLHLLKRSKRQTIEEYGRSRKKNLVKRTREERLQWPGF